MVFYGNMNGGTPRDGRGFTLIELLVVIAIIALLVAILLPSLGKAREASRSVKCMTNMKQVALGMQGYALDFKGQIWESGPDPASVPSIRYWYVQAQNPRVAGNATTNPYVPGPAFGYLANVDKIFECPTNQRRNLVSANLDLSNGYWNSPSGQAQRALFNTFLSERALNFDYTMVTGASGVKVDTPTRFAWDKNCTSYQATAPRPVQPPLANMRPLRFVPAFMEEDSKYYNANGPDGLWSNWDRISNRHGGKGYVAYANGDVELSEFPRGGKAELENETGNFTGNDLWAKGKPTAQAALGWFQVAPSWPATVRQYGWANGPR